MTQAALKLRGPWEVRRKFTIPSLSDAGGAAQLEQALNQVAGVKGLAIDLDRHLVKVRYETTETDYTTRDRSATQTRVVGGSQGKLAAGSGYDKSGECRRAAIGLL